MGSEEKLQASLLSGEVRQVTVFSIQHLKKLSVNLTPKHGFPAAMNFTIEKICCAACNLLHSTNSHSQASSASLLFGDFKCARNVIMLDITGFST